jgi:cytidyltransferase-like protein
VRVIFSGRFDPPHPGHIAQIIRLCRKFEDVVVVTLDYEGRTFPINYVDRVFVECLEKYPVEFLYNTTHFGEITKEELDVYRGDIYAGGNLKVLRHIESLGMKVTYIERAFDYEASKYERLA